MKILIAPDKFKGSLSAMEVCNAIAEGLQRGKQNLEIYKHPLADGGDGSLEVIEEHLALKKQIVEVLDSLGRPISSFYYTAHQSAFIELAQASGLTLLKKSELNPLKTSTYGTGQMIADAISKGCTEIYLFLGGSATNDGGMGIANALGVDFYDHNKVLLKACGENLAQVAAIDFNPTFDINKIKFTLLCDVTNPLVGPNGAAHIYARQKGADDAMIKVLDDGLRSFSEKIFAYSGVEVAELSGSGAAGGVGASLVAIFNAQIKSGIDSFMELTKLEALIQQADVVVSGEGKLDHQSLFGKVVSGVAAICKKYNKPLLIFVGKNELTEKEQLVLGTKQVFALLDEVSDLDDAMLNAYAHLKQLAFRNQDAFDMLS